MEKVENSRTKEIKNIVIMIAITLIIGLCTLVFYISRDNNRYMNYNENSNVDYKVYLKDNDFYKENYLEKDKGYVASLINHIDANFKYSLTFDKEVSYKYSYKIVAEVDVKDEENNNSIYHYSEDLLKEDMAKKTGNLKVNENIQINYEEYNNIISKFKDVYDLKNTEANLNIYLYVNVQELDKSNTKQFEDKKVSSLTIPLTLKTVSIDIGNNIITNNSNKIEVTRHTNYTWVLIIALAYIIISVLYIAYLIIYTLKTRTAQMIYEKEIKSIINNYDSYIQKINGSYDIGTSQVLKIESFSDMLEIRDTLKQPILMLENEEKNGTFFIIPATNSIIYTYALRVVDIKAKMDGNEVPTYDITEIPHSEFLKKKKYTDEYIKEQITMTSAMPKVDEKNVIKGNKDKEKDLYDQLEKTRSFDIKEIKKAEKELKKKEKTTPKKKTAQTTKTTKKKKTTKK